MLTVDYDRLGVQAGERVLDCGCGAGRHAYEAVRRGARVVAYDLDTVEVKDTATVLDALRDEAGAARDGNRAPAGAGWAVNGDALRLPFPDQSFDRVIAAEVLEHIPTDTAAIAELARVVRPGGTVAVTVPRWGPELINWALSDEYHLVPGGHVRIYRERVLASRLRAAGLEVTGRTLAHALHSPYWWLRAAVGVHRDDHPLVRAYHQVLVWDIERAPGISLVTRTLENVLNPVLAKSIVLYAKRPAHSTETTR
jgi:SAM-dependent methyltransferase